MKELFKLVKLNKTKPEAIEKLLKDNNIDINVKNGWGETLIYNCCKHAVNIELLDWLYDKGCDPNIINKKNFNSSNACLMWNHKKNFEHVLDWLKSKNIVPVKEYNNSPLIHNMIICYPEAKTLSWLKKHYDIDEQDSKGNTPLHMSVDQSTKHNSPIPCEWLCSNGANLNIKNNDGQTPLHLACFSGFSNCIKDLIEHGADINIKDNNNKTPLDILLDSAKDNSNNKNWSGDYVESKSIMLQKINSSIATSS